ncbi:MAG: hypothetical protein PHX01_03295 [Clostridia bacterium]|nr:hypothetical protein [Clostridia bacterium]
MMLEEQANIDSSYGGFNWIWIIFIILLILCIFPFIFRPFGPCY